MPREYRVLSRRRETARALRKREPPESFYVEVSIEKRVVFARRYGTCVTFETK